MAILIGDKSRFAVEIGKFWSGSGVNSLRRVDLWAAGRWLTCDDNHAFVTQFCGSVRGTVNWLANPFSSLEGGPCNISLPSPGVSPAEIHRQLLEVDDGRRWSFRFANWGPTTDNICAHLFRVGANVAITFEFARATHHDPAELGQVFVAELPEGEFVQILQQMLSVLELGVEG